MTHHNLSGLLGMNFMKIQRLLLDGQVLRMNQQATDRPPGKQQKKDGWVAGGSLSRNPGPKELQVSKMIHTQAPLMNRGQSQASAVGRGPHGAPGAAGIQPGLHTAISNASTPATLGKSHRDLLTHLSPSRFRPHRPPPSQAHQTAKRPSVAAPEPAGRTSSVADAATCPLLVPAKHPPPSLRTGVRNRFCTSLPGSGQRREEARLGFLPQARATGKGRAVSLLLLLLLSSTIE